MRPVDKFPYHEKEQCVNAQCGAHYPDSGIFDMEDKPRSMDDSLVHFTGMDMERILIYMGALVSNARVVHSLRIAYDPLDRAIKFKVNDQPWSRPFTGRG